MLQRTVQETFTQDHFYPDRPPLGAGVEPDLFIARLGVIATTGKYRKVFIPNHHVLLVILEGSVLANLEDRTCSLGPGDLVCFFPGTYVRHHDRDEQPRVHIWAVLDGRLAAEAIASTGLRRDAPVLRGGMDLVVRPILEKIAEAYRTGDYVPPFPVAATWELITAIANAKHRQAPAKQARDRDLARNVRAILQHEFRDDIAIEQVAERLGVSRSTVFRRFRAAYGVSPKEFLDRLRMDQAKRLLERGHLTVRDAALACGFRTPQHFGRCFRAACGVSPTTYARRNSGRHAPATPESPSAKRR